MATYSEDRQPVLSRIIEHLLEHRITHLLWLIAVSVFFFLSIIGVRIGDRQILPGLKVDNSLDVWFQLGDENWQTYKRFQERFENDEFAVVAFEDENVFRPETLRMIAGLTERLEELPYVLEVTSLTNVEHVHAEEGSLVFDDLIPEISEDPLEIQRVKDIALGNPLYADNIVSRNGKVTGLLIRVEKQPRGTNYQREFTDALYDFVDRETESNDVQFHVSGSTVMVGLQDKVSTNDATLMFSAAFIMIILILYLVHRNLAFVVISLVVVAGTNIWVHGTMPLFGSPYTKITSILATLIIVIGIASSIHFISEYVAQRKESSDSKSAIRRAFLLIALPCLFTSLTTAAGFFAMVVSDLSAIQAFGMYAAIAMVMTFILNMVLVPVWLSFLKNPSTGGETGERGRLMEKYLHWVAAVNRRHVGINIAVAILVLLVSISGILMIDVNTHEIKYFRKNHPMRIDTEFIEEKLTGTFPIEIMLTGEVNAFQRPQILAKVEALQEYMESLHQVQKTFSMVDHLKEMHKVIYDDDPAYYTLPTERTQVAQLMFLGEGSEELSNYVDLMDYSAARIHGRVRNVDTDDMTVLNQKVTSKVKEIFDRTDIKAEVTGIVPLYVNMVDYILQSQIKGFSLALIVIFFMFSLLVRSFKLGLLAMVPNVIPIFLAFGIMGWCGIYLDVGTALIAPIAIGLAVDDTIHFIARFRLLFDRYRDYEKALEETILTIGRPLTITSAVLFFGFATLVLSTFKPLVYFGILTGVTMISALIGDLFVLPALIKVFKPFGPEARSLP